MLAYTPFIGANKHLTTAEYRVCAYNGYESRVNHREHLITWKDVKDLFKYIVWS